MTIEKFQQLSDKTIDYIKENIQFEEECTTIIDVICDKGVWEPKFAFLYVNLIDKVMKHLVGFLVKNKEGDSLAFKNVARRYLNERYRQSFKENILTYFDGEKKRRILGEVVFVSQLYSVDLIRDNTIHDIISSFDFEEKSTILPIQFEMAIKLLVKVGEKMETKDMDKLENYLALLKTHSSQQKPRLRFMFMDLMDLRNDYNWVPRNQREGKKKKLWKKEEREVPTIRVVRSASLRDNNKTIDSPEPIPFPFDKVK
eukprot:UN25585